MSSPETNSTTDTSEEEQAKIAMREMLKSVSANPAEVKFPKDVWGFTSGLKREVLRACSSVRGNEEKHKILITTLAILLQHAHARLPKDKEANKQLLERRAAAAQGRAVKEVYGSSLSDPTRAFTGPVNVESTDGPT